MRRPVLLRLHGSLRRTPVSAFVPTAFADRLKTRRRVLERQRPYLKFLSKCLMRTLLAQGLRMWRLSRRHRKRGAAADCMAPGARL